jgi:predicted alpha/beta-hydrolase family hydrolase
MSDRAFEPFQHEAPGQAAVRGFLHRPAGGEAAEAGGGREVAGLVLTHGAGGNCRTPLLVAVARAFAERGGLALRCDLPYRQARAMGPPGAGGAERDRAGLAAAVAALRGLGAGRVALGGLSYGGRQSTMLAAEQPDVADALLLLSYPLHPPGQARQLRTAHFPRLTTPAVFVHGTRDPFGSIEELQSALALIPGPTQLLVVEGVGHDLSRRGAAAAAGHTELAARALAALGAIASRG